MNIINVFMRIMNFQLLAFAGFLLIAANCAADETPTNSTPEVAPFQLSDQYNFPHKILFPTTNVTIMTVADKKGSDQVDGWIAPIHKRYVGKVAIEGVADVSLVPWLLRSWVQERFKKRCAYPVMLDWDGLVARSYHCHKNQANVFVIGQNGHVIGHYWGITNEVSLNALFNTIDAALANAPEVKQVGARGGG